MKSRWSKWITDPGHIRVVALEGTHLIHELCMQQGLRGPAQVGYGEAVLGALLVASGHKSNESINLNAQGSGVYRQALVDASPEGRVRGFLIEQTDPSMFTFGEHGTNGPWGSGVLSVLYTKNFEGKHPYTGMVPISTGYLDDAINEYYRDSEQLASKIGLDVEFNGTQVSHARGALVQSLGGASPEELELLERLTVSDLRRLAGFTGDFDSFAAEASKLLDGSALKQVETQEVVSFCNCSQERIERALLLSGESEVMAALEDDEYMTITCDFCRREYKFARERLKALFARDPSRLQ